MAVVFCGILMALFLRLALHKYKDGVVYATNGVVLVLAIGALATGGVKHLPFILGFFAVDFLWYTCKRLGQTEFAKGIIEALMKMLPSKSKLQPEEAH